MSGYRRRVQIAGMLVAMTSLIAFLEAAPKPEQAHQSEFVFAGPDGKLKYKPDENGNTIPDFSTCGYRSGGVSIPDVAVKVTLLPAAGDADDTARIQAAIDQVSKLAPDQSGFRGAVLLKAGRYRVGDVLRIATSGVVLRGEGDDEHGTVLFAAGKKQRNLIEVAGASGAKEIEETRQTIADSYVPVGARSVAIADGSKFHVGDTVIVRRLSNAEWIHFIGMDRITPRPTDPKSTKQWEPFELRFDRVIAAVDANKITLDAPLTCAIETKWGGGTIARYEDPGRIENCGVENLRGESEFDPGVTKEQSGKKYAADENHATYLVLFERVKNGWARKLTAIHFYHGPTNLDGDAKWITVEDCRALDPVSEITGGRRYPYRIAGQEMLVQRCYSRGARHAFVFHARVCGPNTFLDCKSDQDYATSEPHHRWSVGGLYDNVNAHMAVQDRQWMGSGHGWAGANYVIWNCEGTLVLQQPPTAQNWAIGFVGKKEPSAFPGRPDGYWESLGEHVEPRSLYLKQLEDRLGASAVRKISADASARSSARVSKRDSE